MAKGLLLLGGGGHCCAIVDSLLSDPACLYDKIAVLDTADKCGSVIAAEITCIGTDDDLERLKDEGYTHAFVTVGSVGNPALRIRLAQKAAKCRYVIPNIVDPTAVVGKSVCLGSGIYVGKRAVLNYGCFVGDGSILNTGCVIEHQCRVGAYCHIAPGTVLCGNATVGDRTHVGAGSVVKQGVSIGSDTVVGLGSVVLHDVEAGVVAFGNPCKMQKRVR